MKPCILLLTAAGLVATTGTARADHGFAAADALARHISEEAGAVAQLAGPYQYDPTWDELYRSAAAADLAAGSLRRALADRSAFRVEAIVVRICGLVERVDRVGHRLAGCRPRTCGVGRYDGLIAEVERLAHDLGRHGGELKAVASTLVFPLPCGCPGPVCGDRSHRGGGYAPPPRVDCGFGNGYGDYDVRDGYRGGYGPPAYGSPHGTPAPRVTPQGPGYDGGYDPRFDGRGFDGRGFDGGQFDGRGFDGGTGADQFRTPALPAPVGYRPGPGRGADRGVRFDLVGDHADRRGRDVSFELRYETIRRGRGY